MKDYSEQIATVKRLLSRDDERTGISFNCFRGLNKEYMYVLAKNFEYFDFEMISDTVFNMKRKPFPILKTSRLLLNQIDKSEVDQIIDISFYDGKQAKNGTESRQFLENINADYLKGETFHWALRLKTDPLSIIGTCGYYRGFLDKTGELGCILKGKYQKQGFMTEAMTAIIDFGFDKLGLETIVAWTSRTNFPALSILSKLNFIEVISEYEEYTKFARRKSI